MYIGNVLLVVNYCPSTLDFCILEVYCELLLVYMLLLFCMTCYSHWNWMCSICSWNLEIIIRTNISLLSDGVCYMIIWTMFSYEFSHFYSTLWLLVLMSLVISYHIDCPAQQMSLKPLIIIIYNWRVAGSMTLL